MIITFINKTNELAGAVNPHSFQNLKWFFLVKVALSIGYLVHFQDTICNDYNYVIPSIVFATT